MTSKKTTKNAYRAYLFGYNGKELENEIKGTGNTYDYGARFYDAQLGRWRSTDIKKSKYPDWSPYHFGYNNPITTIDPNGEENIVIAGGQYDESPGNKLMFVNQAFRQLKWYKKNEREESRSLVLFTEGYTEKQIARIKQIAARKYGASIIEVNTDDELANYINSKSKKNSNLSDTRIVDPVTNIDAFAHGVPQQIRFGYKLKTDNQATFDANTLTLINKSAFSSDAVFSSYACRTGIGISGDFLLFNDIKTENSLAQKISNKLDISVKAFATRTDYSGTLGTPLQRQLNKIGLSPELEEALKNRETIDKGVLQPDGAVNPVTGGDTPVGVSNEMRLFTPKN